MAAKKTTKALRQLSSRPLLGGVEDGRLFCDREDELRVALRAVENRYNVLVVGPRGSGKTSLVHRVVAQTRTNKHLCVVCDMAPLASDLDGVLDVLLYSLAKTMRTENQPERLSPVIERLTRQIGSSVLSAASFDRQERDSNWVETKYKAMQGLTEAVQELSRGGRRLTFFLDGLPPDPDFFVRLFGQYRDFLWQLDSRFFVTCPQSLVSGIWVAPVSSFFDVQIQLKPFSPEMMRKLLEARGFRDAKASSLVHEVSQGNPRLALMLARSVHVGQLSPQQIARFVAHQKHVVASLTASEKEVHTLLRQWGPASASDEKLQRATGQQRTRLTQILRRLTKKGLLVAERKGKAVEYRLRDVVLGETMEEQHVSGTAG